MHINNLFSLKGGCALVIGGAGKVGFPMAEALAEAGARVYIASRSAENYQLAVDRLKSLGLDVIGIAVDQSNESSVKQALKFISDGYKTPDILINSGCDRPMTKFYNDSIENWDKSMEVNSRGLFVTCRIFGNAMALQRKGSIINISSIYGMVAPDMGIYDGVNFETEPDYPFVKGGIIAYSKYLSSYYAKNNVRVNCISPGGVFNDQKEPFLSNYEKKTPLGRMANPNDMKGIALFLASEASSYITGSVIPVDGGWTAV
tara:strand:+ start:864 stop:1643 length:780 start_codon:yes stop_codon:yes gene_type:complete